MAKNAVDRRHVQDALSVNVAIPFLSSYYFCNDCLYIISLGMGLDNLAYLGWMAIFKGGGGGGVREGVGEKPGVEACAESFYSNLSLSHLNFCAPRMPEAAQTPKRQR